MSLRLEAIQPPLVQCALETERYVASSGWDQPPRLFAIVSTARLLAAEPLLADQLKDPDEGALSVIEQEDLPPAADLDEFLARLAWPEDVEGVALAVERVVVPPGAEANLPADPDEAARALAAHPDAIDVRLLVAVMRDGDSTCLLRQRPHDQDDKVAVGREIAPDLVAALAATLVD